MAENKNFSNQGPSPFRRYVPPADSAPTNENGQVMAFPHSSNGTPQGDRPLQPKVPPAATRRRLARNRWRQQRMEGNRATHSTVANPHPPSPAAATPRPQGTTPLSQTPLPRPQPSHTTPPITTTTVSVGRIGKDLPQHRSVPGSPPAAAPRSFPTPRQPSSKVTPIRRRPAWSSPAESPKSRRSSPQAGPRPSRRRGQSAPKPVLYGIRLLIVGTGIAAIVGTLLSTLKPESKVAVTELSARPSEAEQPFSRAGGWRSSALETPLPIAQELAYLETDLVALEAMTPGLAQSVFFYELDTGNYVDINGTEAIAAASTIKVPILVAYLAAVDQGLLLLDQAVVLREELIAGGSGEMQTHEIGSQYTALEVATEMIVNSDNTATNLIIELLGGRDALNQTFQSWGLSDTVLRNPLPDLDGTNTTSPHDLVRLMFLVDQGELLNLRSRDRMFSIMQRTYSRNLIPDGLGDEAALAFNKTGDIGGALGDVALVDTTNGKRYILSVSIARPHNDGRASELIRRIAGRVHEEVNQPISPVGSDRLANPTTDSSQLPQRPPINPADIGNPSLLNREGTANPAVPPG